MMRTTLSRLTYGTAAVIACLLCNVGIAAAQCTDKITIKKSADLNDCWWEAIRNGTPQNGVPIELPSSIPGQTVKHWVNTGNTNNEQITIPAGWDGTILIHGYSFTFPALGTSTHCLSINGAMDDDCTPNCAYTIPCPFCLRVCLEIVGGCREVRMEEVNCSAGCPPCP